MIIGMQVVPKKIPKVCQCEGWKLLKTRMSDLSWKFCGGRSVTLVLLLKTVPTK